MPPPTLPPRKPLAKSNGKKKRVEHQHGLKDGLFSTATLFASSVALLLAFYQWPLRWLISGAPILTYSLLLGTANGYRLLPHVPLWTILPTLHLVYVISATSWLLYWVFAAGCYQLTFLSCLYQFTFVADIVRRNLRIILKQLHFTSDKIAFFDLPALEIDTEVDGLLVIRGVTFHLSSLTLVVHGVEVGIKLSDDMELALQVDHVTVRFFRRIDVGDTYGNLKGGEYEMTFGNLADNTHDEDGDALMNTDTPLLRAAASEGGFGEKIKMTDRLTSGEAPKDSSAKSVIESVRQVSPDNEKAGEYYSEKLKEIETTSTAYVARNKMIGLSKSRDEDTTGIDYRNLKDMRAAICAQLHHKPSVPNPPRRSIKVTTLQNLSPPWQKEFMHRLPALLRALLNPLSYLHPVTISSVTAAASGKWVQHMLQQHVFQQYGDRDKAIRDLEERVCAWLANANFAVEIVGISGQANVPLMTAYNVVANLGIDDLMVYRTLPEAIDLKQVVRLGGADAIFTVPSFLLPHHEHLLPPIPTMEDELLGQKSVDEADGKPKTVQAQQALDQTRKDEANVKISAHIRLPACFDQELLFFISALVKATKVIEMEKDVSGTGWDRIQDKNIHGFRDFTNAIGSGMKDSMKRATVDAVVNDRWIAKLVGKITKKLETAQGDVGYSGDIPVALQPYRDAAETATKLLP